jgi:hypothetical protein
MTTPLQDEVLALLDDDMMELYKTGEMVFNDDGEGCVLIRKEKVYAPSVSIESLTPEQNATLNACDNRVYESFMVGRTVFSDSGKSNVLVDAVPLN